jgi:hypothetical protein
MQVNIYSTTIVHGEVYAIAFVSGYLSLIAFSSLFNYCAFSILATQSMCVLFGVAILPTLV